MINVAIVILNYNGETFLSKFLPKVIDHSSRAEVIVADNKSSDNSIAVLKSTFPSVKLIPLDENYGFAGGYNQALKNIKANYFLLLNSDVEVGPKWIDPLIHFLDQNPSYAACQPKIKDYHDKNKFEYAGASGGFIDSLGYPYCRGRIFNTVEIDNGQYDEPLDIFWSSGACMMIRSNVFFELGGFDQDFFAHMEEIDLCWRIQSAGYKIKCLPESVVYHIGGGTLNKTSPFKTYLNFRNGLYLLLKNLPFSSLMIKFPIRCLLDWIAAVKFIFEGTPKHSLAVIRAHAICTIYFYRMFRKRNKKSNSPSEQPILFKYYLQKKTKFSNL